MSHAASVRYVINNSDLKKSQKLKALKTMKLDHTDYHNFNVFSNNC